MGVYAKTLYDLWEEEQVERMTHSRLYHLEPIGVGTPMVESLTSYVTRLAESHSVYPLTLVTKELLPHLNQSYLYRDHHHTHTQTWKFFKGSAILNGFSPTTSDWVQAIEKVTLRCDLRFLTMLPWANLFSVRNLVRRIHVWCPSCYEEWQGTGQAIYTPLLWTLEVVRTCFKHRRQLLCCCPYLDCGCSLAPLTSNSQVGYCSRCNRWLGSSLQVQARATAEVDWNWQLWVSNALGELLAAAPNLPEPQHRDVITKAIGTYVNAITGGNLSLAARQLEINDETLRVWSNGREVPQLESFMRLSSHLGISPLQLFIGSELTFSQKLAVQNTSPLKTSRKRRRFDSASVRKYLEATLQQAEEPPPSMREVSRRLGYAPSNICEYFPELCRAISTRYQTYLHAQSMERLRRIGEEVRQAVRTLHIQGHYPSKKRVGELLGVPGLLKEKAVRDILQNEKRELGWKH